MTFDARPNMRAEIADIRPSLLSEFLKATRSGLYQDSLQSPVDVMRKMGLLDAEARHPLNAALLFFNEHPENSFPYAYIELVEKPDPTGDGMTEKKFAGPLDKQLRDAISYIQHYIIKETKIKGRAHVQAHPLNYPYIAVREALVNAICHKAYQLEAPTEIMLTPSSMAITSFPGPPPTISDEDIASGHIPPTPHWNPRVLDFLKDLALAHSSGTGIPAIYRAMKDNGSPPPRFETDAERSYFTVILPAHEEWRHTK